MPCGDLGQAVPAGQSPSTLPVALPRSQLRPLQKELCSLLQWSMECVLWLHWYQEDLHAGFCLLYILALGLLPNVLDETTGHRHMCARTHLCTHTHIHTPETRKALGGTLLEDCELWAVCRNSRYRNSFLPTKGFSFRSLLC